MTSRPFADNGFHGHPRGPGLAVPQANSDRLPTGRSYFVLALAFIGFALYGSLLPFDFQPIPFAVAWDQFHSAIFSPASRVSRSDLLANILLFVPIGFTLAGSLFVDRRAGLMIVAATIVILPVSLAVSVLAEFLQTFAVGRISSNRDIAAQTFGCLIGIAAWGVAGSGLTAWLRNALAAKAEDRLSRLLTAFAAAWLFINLAPFDITVDVGDLAQRIRTGKITIVPFSDTGLVGARRIWDYLAETISAAPLGVLGLVGFTSRSRRKPLTAFGFGVMLVVLVETAHVFIRSHSADVTDAILGSFGVGIGVWIGTKMLPHASEALAAPSSRVVSWRASALLALCCLVLGLYHWLPYEFTVDGDAIREKLGRLSLLPFAGYRAASYVNAFNDLLLKLSLSVPLGFSAAFVIRNRQASILVTFAWLGLATCIFAVIEAGQLFLPRRIPDPTDVLVGVVGTYVGLLLGRWLQHGKGA